MNPAVGGKHAGDAALLRETDVLTSLSVEHLCDWSITLEPAQIIATPTGTRMVHTVKHGACEGERLRGEFLPGSGGDWLLVGNDGVARIDVRVTLRTDDGELIYVTNSGVIAMPPEALQRWGGGERIPWNEMYTRSLPRFETSSESYGWLNTIVCVAISEIAPEEIDYRVYQVL